MYTVNTAEYICNNKQFCGDIQISQGEGKVHVLSTKAKCQG